MFKRKEKQSLINARSYGLNKAEEKIKELSMLKNYYKKIAKEEKIELNNKEDILSNIQKLIYNYEFNNTNPFTLIRNIKNELEESGKRI